MNTDGIDFLKVDRSMWDFFSSSKNSSRLRQRSGKCRSNINLSASARWRQYWPVYTMMSPVYWQGNFPSLSLSLYLSQYLSLSLSLSFFSICLPFSLFLSVSQYLSRTSSLFILSLGLTLFFSLSLSKYRTPLSFLYSLSLSFSLFQYRHLFSLAFPLLFPLPFTSTYIFI